MLHYKTGELVCVVEKEGKLVGWYLEGKRYLIEIFDKSYITGVFIKYSLTNNGNTHWYEVLVKDKMFLFTEKQVMNQEEFDDYEKKNNL